MATTFSPGVKTIFLEEDSDDNEDADLWFVLLLLLLLLVVVVASFGFGPDVVELLLLDEVDDEMLNFDGTLAEFYTYLTNKQKLNIYHKK